LVRPASNPNIGQSHRDAGCGLPDTAGAGVLRLLGAAVRLPLQAVDMTISDRTIASRGMGRCIVADKRIVLAA
jgi:hypothetical protein